MDSVVPFVLETDLTFAYSEGSSVTINRGFFVAIDKVYH